MSGTTSAPLASPGPTARPTSVVRRLAQAAGLVGVFALAILAVVYGDLLRARLEGAGYVAVFLLTIAGSATLVLPAPAAISVASFGYALGNPWAVGLVAATGQSIGELTGYYVGWSGKGALQNVRGYATIRRWMERRGAVTLFVLAMIPNPFFDIAGMVAGATRFGVVKFILVSWPGRAIKNIGFAWIGYAGIEGFKWMVG
ncbi:MAG: VTT domain-containing protein [Actinobacteria bacterium]|nr:VTT domain-containing protein [Actinomycetota bacterium]